MCFSPRLYFDLFLIFLHRIMWEKAVFPLQLPVSAECPDMGLEHECELSPQHKKSHTSSGPLLPDDSVTAIRGCPVLTLLAPSSNIILSLCGSHGPEVPVPI